MKANILIVDDEIAIRKALEKFLASLGYHVFAVTSGEEALKVFGEEVIDLALIDLVMPGMNGVELIKKLKEADPKMVCIVMTAFGTITSAVETMKAGAYHYLTKPFELDDVASLVATGLEHKNLKEENRLLRQQLKSKYKFENIVGNSEELSGVYNLIEKVADSDSTILILGESGTGKELVARAIHYNSRRANMPLITVNCAAIPEELLETELFGHVKGSFTGAHATKPGRFDAANGGTIFLDEIGDMSLKLQVKILRVLQERKFEPVGSTKTHDVDVRIITATNRNLEEEVKKRQFREDLFYRLNVIPIKIPPLRERRSDIPLLVQHFIQKFNKENDRHIEGLSKAAMNVLVKYDWPGNIRELENLVERLVILKPAGMIEEVDIPLAFGNIKVNADSANKAVEAFRFDGSSNFRDAVENYEVDLIQKALEHTGYNKNKAAALLGLNRTTLVEKIKRKGINSNDV
ncbi:MAG: DNA-binding response regulator [Deltaproteobacteria bacterium CG11_big_fil_rev_8_21_14_0_20_49_13]|nr:MAG: DNA-binding response regulator [Deltaproteobacteria bacterium CG11_big_fil_rev_8_21_14_0_20_49_13]